MPFTRRFILSVVATGSAAPGILGAAPARAEDPRMTERGVGSPDAKVTVIECFSLTCTHCAAFARETMPQITQKLVDPGKLRFVYHDFPLDQVALTAAMVARSLPAERYVPFINALLNSQDRWAFARDVNSTEELWKMAALAGMSRSTFDSAIGDTALRTWILTQQKADEDKYHIDSTPSFVINGKKYAGEMTFDAFDKLIPNS